METILSLTGICKSFPGIKALDNVSLEIQKGEIHGLVGENGAGKSTLMYILAGVYHPDAGKIILDKKEIEFQDEKDAQNVGVGMVFQERSLINQLSIADNIFAGRQPIKVFNIIDVKKMCKMAEDLLRRVGLDINPMIKILNLDSIQQQLVEIAKALSLNPRILILDEPTSTITDREMKVLFTLIRQLKSQGISIIYISHRIQELPYICDRVSVLKDGIYQGTRVMKEVSLDEIVTMMVGRKILDVYDDRGWNGSGAILEVKNLCSKTFKGISFTLQRQEILGIAGLAGARRSELALALFGCDPDVEGEIYLKGKKVKFKSPAEAIKAGLGYLPEDRKEAGLFLDLDVTSNITSANLDQFTRNGILNNKRAKISAKKFVKNLKINTPSLEQKLLNLSGGNQQKVVLARWLMRNPEILIIDEPTRGVDVGAKSEIYQLIRAMAKRGTSVIVISSELPEILTLCDRIMVMWQGKKTGELYHYEATEEKLLHLASGLKM